MTRYIAVLSGKGGVAKTTTSINLGAALSYFGQDVIVVDTNLTTPNVGLHLGANVVPINLHHVLQGKNSMLDAVYVHPQGTKIVPASISLFDLKRTSPDKLPKVIKDLEKLNPDYVILDGAAGLGREALRGLEACDDVIIVTNPEIPAITDALKTIKLAEELNKNVLGIVLTKTKKEYDDVSISNIEAMLENPVIGLVPYDKSVRKSLISKDAVVFTHPKSYAAIAYKKLAASLIGQEYNEKIKQENIIRRLINRFNKD